MIVVAWAEPSKAHGCCSIGQARLNLIGQAGFSEPNWTGRF